MEQEKYLQYALDFLWNYGPNIAVSLVLLVGGLWIIRRISHIFSSFLKARKVDQSLQPFFSSLVDVAMKVALLLMVAGRLGIETTSFIAIFSAIAFAIGLALQGSLGNFASGVLILLFRPYKIGDIITVAGCMGEVQEIQIFNTILITPQGKRIILPNGKMTEGAIENIEMGKDVRVDVRVSVNDKTDMSDLKQAALNAALKCPGRLENQAPFVAIDGFEEDGMAVIIGCWTNGANYWDTYYALFELVKNELDLAEIKLAKRDEKKEK